MEALALERVMNSIRNGLGIGKTEIAKEPSRSWNPHFHAVFAQVHNTLEEKEGSLPFGRLAEALRSQPRMGNIA